MPDMNSFLHIDPPLSEFGAIARQSPAGELFGYPQHVWREKTRRELGLATDRPVIATGHQTLLWHPGILAKYLALDAAISATGFASANLVVDQHVDRFGEFDVPIRRADGTLSQRRIELTPARPDVPMGLQSPFDPPDSRAHWTYALDSVRDGVDRIVDAVRQHRDQPNAALQMAAALATLMQRWVGSIPNVTATDLSGTSLGRELMTRMADEPHAMAEAYNSAIAEFPEAGIPALLIRDDYVEVPLWRIRPDGRRMRAYDSDVQRALDGPAASASNSTAESMTLLPRALFMTAMVRLGMCDLFIHGTGGANYDRAMERWINLWLGVTVAPVAVVSATLKLPLDEDHELPNVEQAEHAARQRWHDPDDTDVTLSGSRPSATKAKWLQRIEALPRRSMERKAAFFDMHRALAQRRESHAEEIDRMERHAAYARRRADGSAIAERRDWPFPLYPEAMIDQLNLAIRAFDLAER